MSKKLQSMSVMEAVAQGRGKPVFVSGYHGGEQAFKVKEVDLVSDYGYYKCFGMYYHSDGAYHQTSNTQPKYLAADMQVYLHAVAK